MTTSRRNAACLNCDSVTAESRRVDWAEGLDENGEGWNAADVVQCPDCGRAHVTTSTGGGYGRCGDLIECNPDAYGLEDGSPEFDKAIECDGEIEPFDGPMMSAFWPCDHRLSLEDAARALDDFKAGAVCAVELADGETGFGLTGGGMDMSDQIAAAYVAVGHYPPASLRLERHMFHNADRRARRLLNAAIKAGRIAANWALTSSARNRRTLREIQLDTARAAAVAELRAVCGEGVTFRRADGTPIEAMGYRSTVEGQAAEVLARAGQGRIGAGPSMGRIFAGERSITLTIDGGGTVTAWTSSQVEAAPALAKALAKLRRALAALERCK